ncbi:MAG TPA: hypothetical protein VFB06_29565 [Streptosporangiaceae bacterium]|nr:hypothetical protein [Streptosporangiaceae bacterium]
MADQEHSLRKRQEHSLRQRIAIEHRKRNPDLDLIDDLQRQRAVVRVENFASEIFAAAPPLTPSQRQHLAAVMLGGGDDEAA